MNVKMMEIFRKYWSEILQYFLEKYEILFNISWTHSTMRGE